MLAGIDQTALNLAVALILGAAIGFERQWRQRLAGLRTNALVSLGAATFVMFAGLFPGEASPTRMAAQVVSGIGFLGAGLIFKEGFSVRGLNTAATLWCSAAIGVVSGAGFLVHAALATVFVFSVNLLLRPAAYWISRHLSAAPAELEQAYHVNVVCRGADEAHVRALLLQGLAGGEMRLVELESINIEGSDRVSVSAALRAEKRNDAVLERVVGRLSLEPAVTSARWSIDHL
ncbi:MAG: MgtC/SapB family protein [Hyphomicrobium sp.]|nr:MgtC/SapB family protein [Hyphomicrobium sp.]